MMDPHPSVNVTVDPTAEPLTLDEVKTYLRVDSSDEDDFILSLIVAARMYCEGVTKRDFTTQTVQAFWDDWPAGTMLEVPRPFDGSTSTVLRYYAAGSTTPTVLGSSNYWLDNNSEPGRIVLRDNVSWPDTTLRTAKAVELTIITGYGGQSDVPDNIKTAMRLLIGHWYMNREAIVVGTITNALEMAVHALLSRSMVPFFA